MARYCATILLGAFLLFQVQPQIARSILPWFGGGAAVWSTCMLFFQALLLGGYGYAHLLSRRLRPGGQVVVHMSLLAASMYFLPVLPAEAWKPDGTEHPTGYILLLLTATVGMPYLLLSATGPLLQSWFAREFAERSPYRLYALSNLGSLAALLSFPFLFEPNLSIGIQADVWAVAYLLFAVLCGLCGFGTARDRAAHPPGGHGLRAGGGDTHAHIPPGQGRERTTGSGAGTTVQGPASEGNQAAALAFAGAGPAGSTTAVAAPPVATTAAAAVPFATTADPEPAPRRLCDPAPAITRRLRWIGLAALPSVMLLAVTNELCQDLAVIPFLWVLPLSLYLLTFILTFESDRWYRPAILGPLLGVICLTVFLLPPGFYARSVWPLVLLCSALFCCGMVCHGELVEDRPGTAHLTSFYLFVALGGACGGVFVAVLAPLLFNDYFETELALGCGALLAAWATARGRGAGTPHRILRIGAPLAFAPALLVGTALRVFDAGEHVERHRNFFGTLTVRAETTVLPLPRGLQTQRTVTLTHGSTVHGQQASGHGVAPGQSMTYYWPGTGVAHALLNHPARAERGLHVGVIGLGAGTLAHYARNGDRYTFFEIDPDVLRVAERYFTYLKDARARGAQVEVRIGDARIQLERAAKPGGGLGFDLLILDAFNSDAIPVHLLTRECNRVYQGHLRDDGLLVAHVTNRHLDLYPVVRGLGLQSGREVRLIKAQPHDLPGAHAADWIVVTGNRRYLDRPELRQPRSSGDRPTLVWTDDFSSLWHVLK